jgi:leucyl aminopeptidase
MEIKLDTVGDKFLGAELKVLTAFQKTSTSKAKNAKAETSVSFDHWSDKSLKEEFTNLKAVKNYKAAKDETISFTGAMGETVWVVGLGDKTKFEAEDLRKVIAKIYKGTKSSKFTSIAFDVPGFNTFRDEVATSQLIAESLYLCEYSFDKYKSKKSEPVVATIYLAHVEKKNVAKIDKALLSTKHIGESINVMKDFINEAPNVLHSVEYAKRIEADVKKNLKGVKVKILNKAQIQKEKMGLFLSVNSGSAYEPRLVH